MALIGSTIIFFVRRVMNHPKRGIRIAIARKYCRAKLFSLPASPVRVISARMNPVVSPAGFFRGTPAVQIHPYFSIRLISYSMPCPFQCRNLAVSAAGTSSQYPGWATSSSEGSTI